MASVKPVRVVLHRKGDAEEQAADNMIMIDMAIDPETGTSKGPFPAYGRVGNWQKADTLEPFTLLMDGRCDFGKYAPEGHNQKKFQLRPAKLSEGEEVDFDGSAYVIKSVTPLSGD